MMNDRIKGILDCINIIDVEIRDYNRYLGLPKATYSSESIQCLISLKSKIEKYKEEVEKVGDNNE